MFGFYRIMLALWVMAYHLLSVPLIGTYAVFSFFVLSGFLMTTIMHDSYGHNFKGILRYAENRFLRLYPMYWATALFSIVVIIFSTTSYAIGYKDCMFIPHTIPTIIYNFIMLFPRVIPWFVYPRLSPPTWALTVEIFFYICIGLGISRNKKITFSWFLLTIIYYIYSYKTSLPDEYRYAFILGASLPFSAGALLYFYKDAMFEYLNNKRLSSPLIWMALYITNAAIFACYKGYFNNQIILLAELGKYINLFLSVLVVLTLTYKGHEFFDRKLDKKLGDFSYPIYLLHWPSGLLASALLFATPTRGDSQHGVVTFLLALAIVLVVSSIFIVFIDKNISAIRDKIRRRASSSSIDK